MLKYCYNKQDLEEIVKGLKGIGEENRLKIICFLKNGPQCVCDIVEYVKLPQNLVSHHLKVLKDKGFLESKKEGLKVTYYLHTKIISKINNFFTSLL